MSSEMFNGIHVGQVVVWWLSISPYEGSQPFTHPWQSACLLRRKKDLLHALVNDRVATSLTDDEISPLDDDDWHEERRVTGVLESLALSVCLQHIRQAHTEHHIEQRCLLLGLHAYLLWIY